MISVKNVKQYEAGELISNEVVVRIENDEDLLGEAVYNIYYANKIIAETKTLAVKRVIDYARIESRLDSAIEKLEKEKEKFNSLKLSIQLENKEEKRR